MGKVADAFKMNFDRDIVERGIFALIIGAILVIIFNIITPTNLKEAASSYDGKEFCTISDDGSYVMIDTNPYDVYEYISFEADDALRTVNDNLGFPDSVYERMVSTRAIDGVQTYEHDDVHVQWTYHPDNGLEVIYSVE